MRKNIFILLLILLSSMYISKKLYQLNLVQGSSMLPAYKNMELTLIDKREDDFKCGDVIAFYCPSIDCVLIKRIIATPGQTVLISDGNVLSDGIPSPYVCQKVSFSGLAANEITLSANEFFVMGDNHSQSKDSRYEEIGLIARENILGRIIPNKPPKAE